MAACLGFWCVDISVTALLNGLVLTNGFFVVTPDIMYHVGLYVVLFSVVILGMIIIDCEVGR